MKERVRLLSPGHLCDMHFHELGSATGMDLQRETDTELADRLRRDLEQIAVPRCPFNNPDTHRRVQSYVRDRMSSFGLEERAHPFEDRGTEFVNYSWLIGPDEGPRLIIGAHVDTVPGSPGADDNGSGVAALLELGRVLSDDEPDQPVWLVLFTREERDITGSYHFANMCREQDIDVDLMMSLEMLGYTSSDQSYPLFLGWFYPEEGNFIGLVGNRSAKPETLRMAEAMDRAGVSSETLNVPLWGWPVPPTRLSDHCRFWDRGYPALMVTDTAFLRNPNYHMPSDRIDTLDFDFFSSVVSGVRSFCLGNRTEPS